MGGQESSRGEIPNSGLESLEALIGNISAPFALRDSTEKSKRYPAVFMRLLTNNWTDVCKLMDWEKDGAAIDISTFKLAKDPNQVVRSIQAAIVTRGGKLEKYGQDGKFGPETENGLRQALAQTSTLSTTAPTESPPEPVSRAPEIHERQPTMLNFEALMAALKASDGRLKAAGLDIKNIDKTSVTPKLISAYKVKASAFRESLGRENPLLAKLCPIVDEVIKIIEEEIKKIDISSVKNRQDFNDTIRDLAQVIETKMVEKEAQFEQVITEAEQAQLEQMTRDFLELKNLDQVELFTAFYMSAINELVLTAMEHFGKDPDAVENFVELMRVERIIPRKPHAQAPLVAAPELELSEREYSWGEVVRHGPYRNSYDGGFMQYYHELPGVDPIYVHFDPFLSDFMIGDHEADLRLPVGAELTSVQALPNGDMEFMWRLESVENNTIVSKSELDSFVKEVASGKPGPFQLAGLQVTIEASIEDLLKDLEQQGL